MDLQGLINWAQRLKNKIYCDEAYRMVDSTILSENTKTHLNSGIASCTDDQMQVSPHSLYLLFHDYQRLYGNR